MYAEIGMFVLSESAQKILESVNFASEKSEICQKEYDAIFTQADKDGVLDADELHLLKVLHELLTNKVIKRVSKCSECELVHTKKPGCALGASDRKMLCRRTPAEPL